VPKLGLANDGQACTRLVVVAAHPDDESLGTGGLIAAAHDAGLAVYVVLLTAGEQSHPDSPTTIPGQLAKSRLSEAKAALAELAPDAPLVFFGAADGRVADVEADVTSALVDLVGDGRRTLLVAPWAHDGHPDHEAAGRAAGAAARRTGARLAQYPIWMWRHRSPDAAPWPQLHRIDLSAEQRERKDRAIAAHASQVEPLSDQMGDEVLLGPEVLAHFGGRVEHFVVDDETVADDALDELHRASQDPWGVDERWYEQRRRLLTLAALPRRRFRRALEVGCSRGALAEDLAARCQEIVAVDRSPMAVHEARKRLAGLAGATVRELDIPAQYPDGPFDLVVVSEVGYFLSPAELERLVTRIRDSLADDGVVLLCHWRHPVPGWVLDGPDVHERFRTTELPPEAARYEDRDVEIVVLCAPDHWPDAAG
jgi:LmbE family N-acetylglucosaminyl deacetylase/SAM-dependent methyltransferase